MEQNPPEPLVHIQLGETLAVGSDPLQGESSCRLGGLDFLGQAASQALRPHERFPALEISLLVTDDEQLRDLNRRFLGNDAATDVLSFPAGEIDPDSQALYLGDVALSLPRAMAQAEMGGHSLQSELQLLVVHGVLHLLGYDHATAAQKEAMWEVQAGILSQLGSPLLFPLEY
jgi:probable rRNA maturation factor